MASHPPPLRSMLHVDSMSVFRPPSWPWELAEAVLSESRRPQGDIRDRIGEAHAYLRELAAARSDADIRKARRRHPALAAAHRLFLDHGALRDELEARLLAYEAHDAVASKTGLSIDAVAAYSKHFYDIPPRGLGRDFVVCHVIKMARTWRDASEGQVWRSLGYHGGPRKLDLVVDDFHGRPCPDPDKRRAEAELIKFLVRSNLEACLSNASDAGWITEFERLASHPAVRESTEIARLRPSIDMLRAMCGLPAQATAAEVEPAGARNRSRPAAEAREPVKHGVDIDHAPITHLQGVTVS